MPLCATQGCGLPVRQRPDLREPIRFDSRHGPSAVPTEMAAVPLSGPLRFRQMGRTVRYAAHPARFATAEALSEDAGCAEQERRGRS